MEIKQERLEEAKAVAYALERHIKKDRAVGLVPSPRTLIMAERIARIIDEAYEDFEEMLDKMEWDSHKNEGVSLTAEDLEQIGY